MSDVKRIICLANSRKRGARCVAGIELVKGKPVRWLRPVSHRPDGGLEPRERQYATGAEPQLLEIVDVPLMRAHPKDYQSENWLIEPRRRWKKVGTYEWCDLAKLVNCGKPLWLDGRHTARGQNDHLSLEEARTCDHSLRLVHVDGLRLHAYKVDFRPTVQGEFMFAGVPYRLKVTDPIVEEAHYHNEGEFDLGESLLTVSLSEPFNDFCYKLVAAVIPKP